MFGARPVTGRFRRLRWAADAALIALLFAVPWIRVGGEPLVLLDVPTRHFHVLGLVIFPQELYFLWLIVAGLALALFFFTTLFGRVWCGWACPQTVFTDVLAALARRIEGRSGFGSPARVAPWRRIAKHAAFALASFVIGFHLVGYFRSPYELAPALLEGRLAGASVGFLAATSLLAYLDFVLVRQTFCKYLCPYARFQSVLFDRDTLVVGYDDRRGEPRGKRGQAQGDCVDCGLCVAVCPTGIDIRKGLQLECIACTQCIDACDGVMARVGRRSNLIGYRSLVGLTGERAVRILRPRVALYGVLLASVAISFAVLLERRLPMDLQVAHNPDALASRSADGRLGNAFTLRIENRDRIPRAFALTLAEPGFELVAGVNPISVEATSSVEARVFVLARADAIPGAGAPLTFVLERSGPEGGRVVRSARFLAAVAAPGGGAHGGAQR